MLAGSVRAENVLPSPQFAPGSGIEMRITNFYEEIPPSGFLPLRVQIKNHSNAPHAWRFQTIHTQSNLRAVRFVTDLAMEASSERTFDLLVPLVAFSNASSRYSNLMINVSGYGVTDGQSNEHSSSGGRTLTPFVGMGEALSVKHWGALRDRLEKKYTKSLDGTAIDPDLLPEDWRGLAGFEVLLFTDAEWRSIPAAQRAALQDWILQGGKLILCHAGATPPADLPPAGNLGCGSIAYWSLDDNFVDSAAKLLLGSWMSNARDVLQNYTWQWSLAKSVGRPEPPQILILTFVICFATIIGPLNFLVLAPAGNRHRLFWTTPLLSLGASLLMGLFIVFSEGFGGNGQRFQVMLSLPELRKAVLWQEQASRTGVLTSSSFVPSEPALLLPAGLRQTTARHSLSDSGKSYLLEGNTWSGDWFRSRSTQGQVFIAVNAARDRLEIAADESGAPAATSSFAHPLKELWYFDGKGTAWHGRDVRPGVKQNLQRAEARDFEKWRRGALSQAGSLTRRCVDAFSNDGPAEKFFASSTLPRPITSLPSIRWKDSGGFIFGEPAKR